MEKFQVQNYVNMDCKENFASKHDIAYNESLRRIKKNYTTKIHVLENNSKHFDLYVEGSSTILRTANRKKSAILTVPNPEDIRQRNVEIVDALSVSREVERRSSHTDLSKLLRSSRKPHSTLTVSDLRDIQRTDSNHDEVMSTHIKKMKKGIELLQEITQKFSCTETYKEDVEYLMKNINQAINKTNPSSTRPY